MSVQVSGDPYDTLDIIAGAVEYVKCDYCNAAPRESCAIVLYQAAKNFRLPNFAHVGRRMKYVEMRDIFGEPSYVPKTEFEYLTKDVDPTLTADSFKPAPPTTSRAADDISDLL